MEALVLAFLISIGTMDLPEKEESSVYQIKTIDLECQCFVLTHQYKFKVENKNVSNLGRP